MSEPRFILKAGDTVLDWCKWEYEHTGLQEAGTIRIELPIPADKWAFWTQQTELNIDAYFGYPPDPHNYSATDLTKLMTARIDELDFDPARGVLSLSGRDLTSLLIDEKTSEKYPNMTASQIALLLAAKVGLKTKIQPTTKTVGSYYAADHVYLQQEQTLWTLLTYLAQRESMQCFVLGDTLYFGNFQSQLAPNPYVITVQPPSTDRPYTIANAKTLKFSHSMTIARDIEVTVRSYHGARNASYKATATRTREKITARGMLSYGAVQKYDYIIPGLDKGGCQERALQIAQQISQHEYRVEASLPGAEILYPWTPFEVKGTGTPFDATYKISRITRSFNPAAGTFDVQISAKTEPAQQTIEMS